MTEKNNAYDSNLTLSYEGGCPSRFCKPEGYDNGQGKKFEEYDSLKGRHPILLSPNVKRLILHIEKRATYG